jgi:anti-anti-sigma factor
MAVADSSIAYEGRETVGLSPGQNVVWLCGEYDIATELALRRTLIRAADLDAGDLVIDLSATRFLDAITIGVFVRVREVLRAQSRALVLRAPSRLVRRVLEIGGLGALIVPQSDSAPR